LRIAVVALDGKLLRVAVATEDLDCLGRLPARRLRGEELRLRSGLGVWLALLLQPRSTVREQPGGIDLGRHVGELPLDRLELADPTAEGVPLLRVLARDVVAGLRDADRLRGDADPAAVERRHRH